jgi:Transcription factor Pcc1
LNSKFVLRVRCRNAATAKSLAAVLSPDNKAAPSDQLFSMKVLSKSVALEVESERARSGFNTIRSVLNDVTLFREIWLISREQGA